MGLAQDAAQRAKLRGTSDFFQCSHQRRGEGKGAPSLAAMMDSPGRFAYTGGQVNLEERSLWT